MDILRVLIGAFMTAAVVSAWGIYIHIYLQLMRRRSLLTSLWILIATAGTCFVAGVWITAITDVIDPSTMVSTLWYLTAFVVLLPFGINQTRDIAKTIAKAAGRA